MLQSTDPKRLANKEGSRGDAKISLGREKRRDFMSGLNHLRRTFSWEDRLAHGAFMRSTTDWSRGAQPTVDAPTLGRWFRAVEEGRKAGLADWESQEAAFLQGLCFRFCLLLPALSSCPPSGMGSVKWNEPFSPQAVFGNVVYYSKGNRTHADILTYV